MRKAWKYQKKLRTDYLRNLGGLAALKAPKVRCFLKKQNYTVDPHFQFTVCN